MKEEIRDLLEDLCYPWFKLCDMLRDHEKRMHALEVAVEKELEFLGLLTANVMDSRRRVQLEKHLANFRETFNLNQTEEAKP
jgi:hypothetical protein